MQHSQNLTPTSSRQSYFAGGCASTPSHRATLISVTESVPRKLKELTSQLPKMINDFRARS